MASNIPLVPLSYEDAVASEMVPRRSVVEAEVSESMVTANAGSGTFEVVEPSNVEPGYFDRKSPFVPCASYIHRRHVHMMSCYSQYSSQHYHLVLLLVVVFYTIPSIQFVSSNVSYWGRFHDEDDPAANENICHYNEKCYFKIGFYLGKYHVEIPAVNNILSNVGYVMFGVAFILIVAISPPRPDRGLPEPRGMYYALGTSLICEGCFSALFHSCPTSTIFQFDTTFMVVGACYMFAIMYAKRHTSIGISAIRLLLAISAIMLANVLWVVWYDNMGRWFWVIPPFIFAFVMVAIAPKIVSRDFWDLVTKRAKDRELIRKPWRLVCGALWALANCLVLLLCVVLEPDYFYFSLGLVICNAIAYVFYYIALKILHNEKVYWYIYVLLFLSAVSIIVAFRFYWMHTFDTNLGIEESKALNRDCVFLGVWDALSVFFIMVCVYLLDLDQRDTPRDQIHVF